MPACSLVGHVIPGGGSPRRISRHPIAESQFWGTGGGSFLRQLSTKNDARRILANIKDWRCFILGSAPVPDSQSGVLDHPACSFPVVRKRQSDIPRTVSWPNRGVVKSAVGTADPNQPQRMIRANPLLKIYIAEKTAANTVVATHRYPLRPADLIQLAAIAAKIRVAFTGFRYISPKSRRLVWQLRAMMTWSCNTTPSGAAAFLMS